MGLSNVSVILTWILFISTVHGIRKGHNATKAQFPYHAAISNEYIREHFFGPCSGAIISEYFILTSYECVAQGTSFEIEVGCLHHGIESPACVSVTAERFYVPPSLTTATFATTYNDVALLQTDEKIPFSYYIGRVNIPRPTIEPFVDKLANVTGYSAEAGKYLQWLQMKSVHMLLCHRQFPYHSLQNSICAHGVDGDGIESGSLCYQNNLPLVANNILIGILKKVDLPCADGGLNLFIDVQQFAGWINNTITVLGSGIAAHNATQNEFPYHAHIVVFDDNRRSLFHCSGAVIGFQFVITTKACVWNGKSFRIILGSLNPHKAGDNPAYDHETTIMPIINGKVALLQMEKDIPLSDRIQTIKLPYTGRNAYESETNYYAIATGYILDEPNFLQWLYMRVIPVSECKGIHGDSLLDSLCVRISEADYYSGGLCQQGVPLVLNRDRKTLIGILDAFANTCMDHAEDTESIFINVKPNVPWIEKTIAERVHLPPHLVSEYVVGD